MIRIPSPSYHVGRASPIRIVVLHTAESNCEPGAAQGIARYLSSPSVRASCHYVVDPFETVQQVLEGDTAWTAPGANSDGIQIEQAGRARFTADEWAVGYPEVMVRAQIVPLVADICRRHNLPAMWLSAADLLAGKRGITDHNTVNEAYGLSDHWDCGPGYPKDRLVSLVNLLLRNDETPPPVADDEEDDMLEAFETNGGDIIVVSGLTFSLLPKPWEAQNAQLIELVRAGRLAATPAGVPIIKKIGDNAVNALVRVK